MQPSNSYLHQPPRLVSHTHYCVVGDVTVDSTAAIAPGAVLQAPSGSRIVIEKGVCIAGGVCLQSRQGVLKISAGASLGANVLIIGHGSIGANACVSPSSTLINPQIERDAIVPPCSIIDRTAGQTIDQTTGQTTVSQTANQTAQNYYAPNSYAPSTNPPLNSSTNGFTNGSNSDSDDNFRNTFVEPPPVGPKPIEIPDLSDQNGKYRESVATQNGYGSFANDVQLNNSFSTHPVNDSNQGSGLSQTGSSALTAPSNGYVYGRNQVSQLISTLFPNRQPLNNDS